MRTYCGFGSVDDPDHRQACLACSSGWARERRHRGWFRRGRHARKRGELDEAERRATLSGETRPPWEKP